MVNFCEDGLEYESGQRWTTLLCYLVRISFTSVKKYHGVVDREAVDYVDTEFLHLFERLLVAGKMSGGAGWRESSRKRKDGITRSLGRSAPPREIPYLCRSFSSPR